MTAPKNLWIRVDADAPMDPKFAVLAESLEVDRGPVAIGATTDFPTETFHAFGMCVSIWCAMAFHAPDGDLSNVPDSVLEQWARWHGRPGQFAEAFRALFTQDGVCQAFRARQSAIHRPREQARERLRKFRERNANGNVSETPKKRPTERNGTEHKKTTAARSKKAGGDAPSWPAELVAAHESVMGVGSGKLLFSRYGKAFGGLVEAHGVEACADAIKRAWASAEAKYLSPEKIALRFQDFRPQYDTSGLADAPSDTLAQLGIAV